ncbi:hypothetical protein JCM9279_003925 [Rhodotorula babjevae]
MHRQHSRASSTHSDSDSAQEDDAQEYRSLPSGFRRRASSFFQRRPPRDEHELVEAQHGSSDDEPPHRTGMFSRRAREASRPSRSRAQSLSALDSPHLDSSYAHDDIYPHCAAPASRPPSPPSPNEPDTPFRLFAPTFSQRQLARLSRASQQAQERDERKEKKERGRGHTRAELKVAMGVLELVESQREDVRRGRGKSGSRARSSTGAGEHGGLDEVLDEVKSKGTFGAFEAVEEQVRHRASEAGEPARHDSAAVVEPIHHGTSGFTAVERQRLAEVGGAATLMGVVGAGLALYEHERAAHKKRDDGGSASRASSVARTDFSTPRPSSRASAAPPAPSRPLGTPTAIPPAAHEPQATLPVSTVPRPLSAPVAVTTTAPATPYFSQLTPTQHHLVQHAAAALLLKDKKRGTLHDDFEKAIGGIEHLVERLEESIRVGARSGKGKRLKKLFGTPLPDVTKQEGIDSFHGANPHGTVRVPEFIDHCITALMQMDMTTEGIFRKSGNLRVLSEIMHALDHSGGDDTVIDLAALDPITLADLLKRFLASLPHPVLTGHLFELFVACSHIKNVGLRRRALHLVICLMPRVNRDVFEVIGVFLVWLSQFAHIAVKVGNKMDLSAIATVLAPTLLRPAHRDAKPAEYPSMIAAVLSLFEEQQVLHAVPYELAQVLHLEVPHEQIHREGGSSGLVQHLARLL